MKKQTSQGIINKVSTITGVFLTLLTLTFFSCNDYQEQEDRGFETIEFVMPQTRATDTAFENGDKIGVFVVESGKNFVETGNYSDNKQYSFASGKFLPVTPGDQIFVMTGNSYKYFAYYPYQPGVNPRSIEFNAVNINTKNRPLWSMNNSTIDNIVQFNFENVMGLVEVDINETSDKIASGTILNKQPKVLMNMCDNKLTTLSYTSSVPLILYKTTNSISTFRALLPAGNVISSGTELFNFTTIGSKAKKFFATTDFTITSGNKNVFSLILLEEYLIKATSTVGGNIIDGALWLIGKKFKSGEQCSLAWSVSAGYFFDGVYENNIKQDCILSPYTFNVSNNRTLEVRFKPDVITYGPWTVNVSANPTTIAAGGGTSAISTSARRDVFTNGVKTSTESATPSLSASGTGFSLSGTTLTAGNNTGSVRSCTVTATHAGVNKTCTVTQNAASITYGGWTVNVSANPTTIAAGGGTSAISTSARRDVFTNGVKTSTESATPSLSASGTGFSLSGTTLTAGNNTGSVRSCTVTATHAGVNKTCTVTQNAASITYGGWTVNVSADPTTIAAGGGTSTISRSASRDVFTNGVKTSTESATPTLSASGAGFSLSGTTLTAVNNTGSARSCTVTATHAGVNAICTVTQSAAVITYGGWTVNVSASPTNIAAGGGTSTISRSASRDVFTNGVKTSTESATPTLSASGAGFSLSGTTLTAGNNTGSARSCTVTATHAGANAICTVTQSAVSITYGGWTVNVSASPTNIAAGGGTSTISRSASRDVFTNGVKTSTESATPTLGVSGVGFSLSGTTLTAGNNTGSTRSCTVTATYGGANNTCTVTQSAAVITWQYNLSATPTFLAFASKGETKSFTVTSTRTKIINGTVTGTTENTAYTSKITENASVFSVSGTSVTAQANSTTGLRYGTLTITQTNSGKTSAIDLEQDKKIDIGTETP